MTSLPNSIRLAMAAEGGAAAGDDFLWLEELQGKKALQWVQQENQRTVARFGQGEDFQRIEREVLDIQRRVEQVCRLAGLERRRLLQWILAWAGLSAAWFMEDGQAADIDFRVAELAARALDLPLPAGDSGFILPVIERG